MAETIQAWLERQLREVEEDGKSTKFIRLAAGDSVQEIETFESPLRAEEGGPGPEKLAEIIEEVLEGERESWPKNRNITCWLFADDGNGKERAHKTFTKKGKGGAGAGYGTLGNESLAHAETAQAHTATTKALLGAANAQIALLQKTNETLAGQVEMLIQQLLTEKLQHAQEMANVASNPEVAQQLLGDLGKVLEPLAQMGMEFLMTKKTTAGAAAAASAPSVQ